MRVDVHNNRESWLDARKNGIGGSEAAAVLQVSPWAGPYKVALSKRGLLIDTPMTEQQEIGLEMEPVLDRIYTRRTERELTNPGDFTIYWGDSPQFATLDRVRDDRRLVEFKTTGSDRDWRNGPPLHYQVQVQHQMSVADSECCDIAVMFGSPVFSFRIYTIDRNDRFISGMSRAESSFWEIIQSGEFPAVDDSIATAKALSALRAERGESVELPADAAIWVDNRNQAAADAKAAKQRQQKWDNLIKAAIGTAEIGLLDGTKVATFATDSRGVRRLLMAKKGR